MPRGLFVGRFQPFHKGHLEAVLYSLERVDELIIVIGSSQYDHELINPFTAGERIMMVKLALNEAGIEPSRYFIVPVPDVVMHSTWFSELRAYVPSFEVIFSNEALTRRLVNEAGFSVENVPLFRREIYWSTEIRKRIISYENWSELVPKSVEEYLIKIDGIQRIIDLERKDSPNLN